MVSAGRRDDGPFDPPAWEIPGPVPAERIVTRSDDIVVTVGPVRVYSTGAVLAFHVRFRPGWDHDADALQAELLRQFKLERSPGADRLVLVLRSADGSLRTNVERAGADAYLDVLHGRGRDSEWSLTCWIWPAPADDVAVSVAWPRWRVPEGETTLTGEELRAAAAGVRQLD
jgi:hypothetical protein